MNSSPPNSSGTGSALGSGLGAYRHWLGKLILGLLGLLKGGWFGALVGLAAGHLLDRFIGGLLDQGRVRGVFVNALFASLGHVLKADGRISEVEIASAEKFMHQLGLSPEERRDAIARFNAGKARDFDLEGTLDDFSRLSLGRGDLRQMFLEILLEGAATDGDITAAEQEVLGRVARKLHVPSLVFVAMINAYRATHRGGAYTGPRTSASSLGQAYASLGLEESASDAEVKRAYRKLMRQYHPDRLVSQGLPDEVMERAKNRVLEINAAYDRIKSSRGFK